VYLLIAGVTFTVTLDDRIPEALVAWSVYVVVVAGVSTREPFAATCIPFNVTVAASVVVHDRVTDWPAVIEVALAVSVAVGAGSGGGCVTVTVTLDVAVWPAELVARSVYVVVAAGV
jgi:hypothetical protein